MSQPRISIVRCKLFAQRTNLNITVIEQHAVQPSLRGPAVSACVLLPPRPASPDHLGVPSERLFPSFVPQLQAPPLHQAVIKRVPSRHNVSSESLQPSSCRHVTLKTTLAEQALAAVLYCPVPSTGSAVTARASGDCYSYSWLPALMPSVAPLLLPHRGQQNPATSALAAGSNGLQQA